MSTINEVKIRFNYGRVVAVLNKEDLNQWVLNSDLHQPFMYTIHGIGAVTDVDRYINNLS